MTPIAKKIIRNCAVFGAALSFLISAAPPAEAYYWGNYGFGLANSLLWPLRSMGYGRNTLGYLGGPLSYRNPVTTASYMLQSGAGTALRAPSTFGVYPNSVYYTENQVLTSPQNGLVKVPSGPSDQISYAQWTDPSVGKKLTKKQKQAADKHLLSRAPGADGSSMPVYAPQDEEVKGIVENNGFPAQVGQMAVANPPLGSGVTGGAGQMPPHAPSFVANNRTPNFYPSQQSAQMSQMPALGQAAGLGLSGSNPVAAHFIETINGRFDGDIGKAFKHSETRNLAEAMGLIDRKSFSAGDLSPERVDTISRILKDNHLDATSKLDAMRIMLRMPAKSVAQK